MDESIGTVRSSEWAIETHKPLVIAVCNLANTWRMYSTWEPVNITNGKLHQHDIIIIVILDELSSESINCCGDNRIMDLCCLPAADDEEKEEWY